MDTNNVDTNIFFPFGILLTPYFYTFYVFTVNIGFNIFNSTFYKSGDITYLQKQFVYYTSRLFSFIFFIHAIINNVQLSDNIYLSIGLGIVIILTYYPLFLLLWFIGLLK